MGRRPRSQRQHGYFHVLNRGVARQPTFFDDADRVDFGRVLAETALEHDVEVHAYCLMPNHYHLVLNSPFGSLSTFMQRLIAVHTRHTNDRWGRDGPLYRGRFRSLAIDDDGYLLAAVRYVHRNPLALVHDGDLEPYRWSSHRAYLGLRNRPPFLRTDVVLGLFGDDVERYRRFVHADGDGRLALPAALELAIDEHCEQLGRGLNGVARTIALHLVAEGRMGSERLVDVGVEFANDRSRRNAISRATRLVGSDPVLATIAERAAHLSDVVSDTRSDVSGG